MNIYNQYLIPIFNMYIHGFSIIPIVFVSAVFISLLKKLYSVIAFSYFFSLLSLVYGLFRSGELAKMSVLLLELTVFASIILTMTCLTIAVPVRALRMAFRNFLRARSPEL